MGKKCDKLSQRQQVANRANKKPDQNLVEYFCLTNTVAEHFVKVKQTLVSIARIGRIFARQFLWRE